MSGEASDRDDLGWGDALRLFESDLRRRGSAEKVLRAYGLELRRLAVWAIDQRVRPEGVDLGVLRRYAAHLGAAQSEQATVARQLAAIRAFLRVLREHGLIAQNPADLLPAPQRRQPVPRALKPSEVAALLDRIPAATPLQVRDRAIFELTYTCGLRADELVGLDVGSVALDAAQLRVAGKGGRVRRVPVGEAALRSLARYLERARPALEAGDGDPALLLSKSGRRLSTSDVRRRLRTWEDQAAIQGGTAPNALRQDFATHLLEGGADVRAIQDLLGDASVSTTQIYTRVDSARLKTAYARSHPRA